MDNDKWIKDLRGRFEDYSAPVPEGLWEGISSGTSRRRLVALPFWKIASGLAAAAAVAVAVVLPLRKESPVKEAADKPDSRISVVEAPVFDALDASTGSSFTSRGMAAATLPKSGSRQFHDVVPNQLETVESFNSRVPDTTPEESVTEPLTQEIAPASDPAETPGKPETAKTAGLPEAGEPEPVPLRKNRRGISIGISGSNPSVASSSKAGYGVASPFTKASGDASAMTMSDVMLFSANKPTTTTERHELPVNAGITLSFPITDRLSVGTGLIYSRLISSFHSGTESNYYDMSQTVNYLGIPLTVRYDFLRFRMVDIYASVGAAVRKCVGARQETVFHRFDKVSSEGPESVGDGNISWSADAGCGVQFNATKWLGIYSEPGFTYHFHNSSPLRTVYSARPADFSLQFGLRFTVR